MDKLFHFLRFIKEHLLFKALDKGIDIGGMRSVDFEEMKDSVFKVFDFEFGGLRVFGSGY